MNDELTATKEKLTNAEQELSTLRAQVMKLNEDVTKATEDANAKEVIITDLRAKELQVGSAEKMIF